MKREIIATADAPKAIGTYSQAVRVGDTIYLSGQIPLDPAIGELVQGDMRAQIARAFDNLQAVARAAGADLNSAVRLTIYLADLADFPLVNEVMARYCREPYPARVTIGVAALPRGARVEIDGVLVL
ncbi:MAG TPA: RidA family protein [Steroidobacter sp.]|jgi:reactive intermediate/imine deaminase